VGTVQSGEVFIAEQMVSVLGQVSVPSVAADKIQIQMVSSKQWLLRGAAAHHDRGPRPGRAGLPREGRAMLGSCLRAG